MLFKFLAGSIFILSSCAIKKPDPETLQLNENLSSELIDDKNDQYVDQFIFFLEKQMGVSFSQDYSLQYTSGTFATGEVASDSYYGFERDILEIGLGGVKENSKIYILLTPYILLKYIQSIQEFKRPLKRPFLKFQKLDVFTILKGIEKINMEEY